MARYLEDLVPGASFESAERTITAQETVAFAREFDPQPFHLDAAAARDSFFGELVASGWHTAALTMRMMVESGLDLAGGLIGAGVEQIRWPKAVRPGDVLRVRVEVVAVRESRSRPDRGLVNFRTTTLRGDDVVQELTGTLVVPRRPAS